MVQDGMTRDGGALLAQNLFVLCTTALPMYFNCTCVITKLDEVANSVFVNLLTV